jgi:hypothetical protein
MFCITKHEGAHEYRGALARFSDYTSYYLRLRMIRVDLSKHFLATLTTIAALAGSALAQSSGSISGSVQDSHGGVIQDGAVTVSNPLGGVSQTTRTNSEGNFVFPQLPPGTYTVAAEMPGFKKSEKKDVVLPAASRVNVGNMVLEVGAVTETVTVAAEAGQLQIQSESGERSNLVTNRQLRDIGLNGRNVVDLMRTIPCAKQPSWQCLKQKVSSPASSRAALPPMRPLP